MELNKANTIKELEVMVKSIRDTALSLKTESETILNHKETSEKWSVLECIEHLNRYCEFYVPEIDKCLRKTGKSVAETYKTGYFGNKSALSMLPKEQKVENKMKTFKSKNPSLDKNFSKESVDKFLEFQNEILQLLERAKQVDLGKPRTKLTLPLLKFKLGDTLRFFIYHQERHRLQIKKAFHLGKAQIKSVA